MRLSPILGSVLVVLALLAGPSTSAASTTHERTCSVPRLSGYRVLELRATPSLSCSKVRELAQAVIYYGVVRGYYCTQEPTGLRRFRFSCRGKSDRSRQFSGDFRRLSTRPSS